jgi:hypothetical protein
VPKPCQILIAGSRRLSAVVGREVGQLSPISNDSPLCKVISFLRLDSATRCPLLASGPIPESVAPGYEPPVGQYGFNQLATRSAKVGDAEQHGCDDPRRGKRFGLDVYKVVTCPSGLDEMWCWTRVLWQTVGVEKVALIIESGPDDKFLVAACSACPTRFRLPGNTLGHKELLRKKFEIHCRGVHPEADCPNPNRSRMAS